MDTRTERLEKENAALRADLNKRVVENDCALFKRLAEFTPDEIRKWDPDVKRQVREEMTAAIARVKALFSEDSDMIQQFILSAQGVLALLDCDEVGPTGTTAKSAVSAADRLAMMKQIHAGRGTVPMFAKTVTSSEQKSDVQKQVEEAQRKPTISGRELCAR